VKTILAAGGFALLLSLFGTPLLIRVLAKKGYGQIIRDDGPSSHHTKRGTPTMGGIIIIIASIAAYLIAHLISTTPITASAALVIALVVALGFVGFFR
jgi:phospho-N-acetylmuramoyl-pentapeptide-transferase